MKTGKNSLRKKRPPTKCLIRYFMNITFNLCSYLLPFRCSSFLCNNLETREMDT